MHDKIKELVKQAGGHISMRNLASNPVQHIESVELWDDKIEKFAELLVRECVDLIDSMDHSSQYFPHVSDTIKQHFGVKE